LPFYGTRASIKIGIDKAYYTKTLQKGRIGCRLLRPHAVQQLPKCRVPVDQGQHHFPQNAQRRIGPSRCAGQEDAIHPALEKIFKATVPKLKTQTHFYGYDGRGSDPSQFDCIYTYNLGLDCFQPGGQRRHRANGRHPKPGAWFQPLGTHGAAHRAPHAVGRTQGKLTLVLEKSVVDVQSPAFRVVEAFREKWLAACPGEDQYRRPASCGSTMPMKRIAPSP
jgi:pyrophosphate--fructose-6-phosphate 1-phosphotransferase